MALWRLSRSIGAKIFGALVAMGLIAGALGFYGLYVLAAAGAIVVDTYDRPLMAINFARSASLTFMQMDKEVLRRRIVVPTQQAGIDKRIEELTASFFEDLVVADNRSLAADDRFVERRKAISAISSFEYTSFAASLAALLLSGAITWLLARRIIRPLSAAAAVADRIAGGRLDTPIPVGGGDETGILLRSMTVMQDNIRV